MKTDITTCIVLDKRRKRKDDLYPLKVRVTFNRYSRYYKLGYALTCEDFEKMMSSAANKTLKSIRLKTINIEAEAQCIIDSLDQFSYSSFDELFLKSKPKNQGLFTMFKSRITKLNSEQRIKTAGSYNSALSSLEKFSNKSNIPINKVTISFLNDYEKWMINSGKSLTTVGIYCRNIRTIFNEAIETGCVKNELYPFGRGKYVIPNGNGVKKALTKADIIRIKRYEPKNDMEDYSKDMWLFSYLANGMNFTDIANLKQENISDGFLMFIRSKTKRSTRSKPILVRIYLIDELKQIIKKRKCNIGEPIEYLFPILDSSMTIHQKVSKVELVIRSVNYHMDKIAKALGISKKVTTYTARHTFSTVLKRSGAPIEYISESLGHQSIMTTRHYLDSFEDKDKIKWSKKLL